MAIALVLVGGAGWLVPRLRAVWDVHGLGASLGDYAVCMAGPTGPETLRDDPTEFRRLVRRRLLSAAPDDAPFARCAKSAAEILPSESVQRAHQARARSFIEYGVEAKALAPNSLADLVISAEPLLARTREAWPLMRGSSVRLIRPSFGAREAVHPLAPARPLIGRGLPAARAAAKSSGRTQEGYWVSVGTGPSQSVLVSSDFGQTFRPARGAQALEQHAACVGPSARSAAAAQQQASGAAAPRSDRDPRQGFQLSSGEDGSLLVTSQQGEGLPQTETAVRGEHQLLALACDDDSLTLAARSEHATEVSWLVCARGGACSAFSPPKIAPFTPLASTDFDLARVGGTTVLAIATHGVVRVSSSRDNGQTWAPPAVAFDAAEYPAQADVPLPNRLTALGTRLLLHGAPARSNQSYALLVSDDQGASFRGDGTTPVVPEIARVAGGRHLARD